MAASPRRAPALRALLWQALVIAAAIGLAWLLVGETLDNMRERGMRSGFGFLRQPAGFSIGESLIAYEPTQPYWRAFLAGFANTLRVALPGIVLATLAGGLLGIGRLSRNALLRAACGAYVEAFRNVPLLLQLLVAYFVVTELLPPASEALSAGEALFLSKSGLALPAPVWRDGLGFELPARTAFGVAGGATLTPEFLAVLVGLVAYTAAYVAEIVRAGLQSVPYGQVEAAKALGLTRRQRLRLVVLPQAKRVIVPALTNQYLNLVKNSSLAVAVGYPDLMAVSNTALNQTGRAVECIAIVMAVYLAVSLLGSALMNRYNAAAAIAGRPR